MTIVGGLPLALSPASKTGVSLESHLTANDAFSQDETKGLLQLELFEIMYSGKDAEFDRIVKLVKAFYSAPLVAISFIDKSYQFLKSFIGEAQVVLPRNFSICTYTIQGTTPLIVYDAKHSELLQNHPMVVGEPYVRFYAGFPILVTGAEGVKVALGALCLVDSVPHPPLTASQIETCQQFAQLVSDTLQSRLEKLRANRAAQAKIAFLTNISHEIRTPMTGIVGMLDTLLQTPLDEQQQLYVNHIKNANEQLMVLVNDMLDLSQVEAGKFKFHKETVDCQAFVAQKIAAFTAQANQKQVRLQLVYPDDIPQALMFDKQRVGQIIHRLLENAITFTSTGGQVTLQVSCEILANDPNKTPIADPTQPAVSMLKFQVIDTGVSISPQTQAVIFKAYEQADKFTHRVYGGIGLGLSLCKALAVRMGGDLTVNSQMGEGTTFCLQLPLQQEDTMLTSMSPNQILLREDEPRPRLSAHILLVEDNEVNAMVALKTLKKYGYTADRAKDGQEAINFFSQSPNKYHLILMDHQMPIMDGVQATKILKQRFASLPPVIAVTAHATHGNQSIYFVVGMQDCIAKPYKPELLDGVIQKWLYDKPTTVMPPTL